MDCAPEDFPILLEKSVQMHPWVSWHLNLMLLLLHHSGDMTGGWTFDPPRPVTHPNSLTEEGAYGASEPPTSTILMAHVESLKQNSILELMQQSISDTS